MVIKETYGGIKTYINQIYLYEDFPEVENKKSGNESKKSFSTNNLSYHKNKKNNKINHHDVNDEKKENNNDDIINEENIKNVDTDSEDSLQNTPQQMYKNYLKIRISNLKDPVIKKINLQNKLLIEKEVNLSFKKI